METEEVEGKSKLYIPNTTFFNVLGRVLLRSNTLNTWSLMINFRSTASGLMVMTDFKVVLGFLRHHGSSENLS